MESPEGIVEDEQQQSFFYGFPLSGTLLRIFPKTALILLFQTFVWDFYKSLNFEALNISTNFFKTLIFTSNINYDGVI